MAETTQPQASARLAADAWTDPAAPRRRHALAALALALIPFVTMCLSVSLWDRIDPRVLGLPFNLFWLGGWEVLTVACLALAYRLGKSGRAGQAEGPL